MSQQKELTIVITENIEKAFIFVGGEESKALYDSRIAEVERERIIKLIEGYDWFAHALQEDGLRLIALIKGENK